MIDFSAIAFPASEDENEVIVVDDQDVQHGRKGREKISGKVETENEEESFWHGGWDLTELPRAATNSLTAMAACGGAVGKQHPVIASTTTYDHFRPPQPPLPQARPPALLPKTIPVGKLTVTNVVITCDLGTQLDLRQIATKLPNTMFLKTKTGGTNWCCTVELRRPRAILRVFESGKVLCIGAKSLERAERAVQLLAARLSRSGLAAGAAVSDLKVQNMVLVSTLPTPTEESLQHLAKVSRVCTYDRSVFAGLKYDPPGNISDHLLRESFTNMASLRYQGGRGWCESSCLENALSQVASLLTADDCPFLIRLSSARTLCVFWRCQVC